MYAALPRRVAVVGAGAAGLSAARALQARGVAVTVFDKGRKPGGRIALRETAYGNFDHGAQSLAVGGAAFMALLDALRQHGQLAPWAAVTDAQGHSAAVAVPTMHTLALHCAEGLDVRCTHHVESIEQHHGAWQLQLRGEAAPHPFNAIVVTVPEPQLGALLPTVAPPPSLAQITYDPCWTLLWVPAATVPLADSHQSFAAHPMLTSMTREDRKPGRGGPLRYVVHATAAWSEQMLELPADEAAALLQAEAAQLLGIPPDALYLAAHRWRYARVRTPLGLAQLTLAPGLHYASDGCLGDGIESAMISGAAAAEALLAAA